MLRRLQRREREREREERKERARELGGGAERAGHGFGVLRSGLCPRRIERYDESRDLLPVPVVGV